MVYVREAAREVLDGLADELATKMRVDIAPQKSLLDDVDKKLSELKAQAKFQGNFTIPESVYEKIGQLFYDDLAEVNGGAVTLSTDPFKLVHQIVEMIGSWTEPKTADVDGYY